MELQNKPVYLRGKALDLLLILLISLVSVTCFLGSNPQQLLVFDDSYITLRFAENFFTYSGITYDGSTFFSGATSPLHIICIALLGLFMKMEQASLAIGVIFFVLSSFLVYLWTLALYGSRRTALLAGILTATSGWLVFDSLNGMETTAFIFFSLLTFYLYYRYQPRALYAVPLALSVLTRPDGWFLAGALWMWQIIRYFGERDKQRVKHLVISIEIFLILILPYLLLSLYQTGSLLSNTAYAKAAFFGEGTLPFINKAGCFMNGLLFFYRTPYYPAILLLVPLLLCARKIISLSYLWLYIGFFYLSYFLFFPCSIRHYWCRYQHIFIPLIILAMSGGAFEVLKRSKKPVFKGLLAGLAGLVILYNQAASFTSAAEIYSIQLNSMRNPQIDLARWLNSNTPDDSLIALHDIGAVGYFSERKVLDLVGLVNPEVTRYYLDPQSKRVIPLSERRIIDYLKEKRPDYLVMFTEWDRFFNLLRPDNEKYFKLLHTTLPLYPTTMRYRVFKCSWD